MYDVTPRDPVDINLGFNFIQTGSSLTVQHNEYLHNLLGLDFVIRISTTPNVTNTGTSSVAMMAGPDCSMLGFCVWEDPGDMSLRVFIGDSFDRDSLIFPTPKIDRSKPTEYTLQVEFSGRQGRTFTLFVNGEFMGQRSTDVSMCCHSLVRCNLIENYHAGESILL